MSDFKNKFGANLKILRKSFGITQEKLAELIDLHHRQLSKIETGDNFPSCKTLEKLCYVLKVSPTKLFDFDFVYEGEIVLTGTYDIPFYRAIKQDNVITLEDYKGKKVINEDISILDSDKRILGMASNLKKSITVEYFENGEKTKVLVYNPDGSIKSSKPDTQKSVQEAEKLMELFKSISKNEDYVEFIKLAIKSIEDDSALERLEFMVNGIKMARRSKSK